MQRQKILIIDDEPAIVSYYTLVLEAEYTILSTSGGKSALYIISHLDDIDLVILDYKLRDMSGIDVLREIKKIRPSIPVILITAYGDEDLAIRSFRSGVKEYIKKPVTYAELFEKVRFCLSLKSANKSNRATIFLDAAYQAQSTHNCSANMSHNFLKIQKAVQHIDDNFTSKLNLSIVAGKACMSRHHFSRTFKKTMGSTFQNYLNERRMNKAKDMLKYSHFSISEIAFSVGYDDITHFTRMFKRMTGYTPSQYKNNSTNR